jgi:hypothetical protein
VESAGRCVFELRDGLGASVGPTTLFVGLETSGTTFRSIRLRFGSDGCTGPIAVPAGDHTAVPPEPAYAGPIERHAFSVRSGEAAHVPLRLAAGGILVEVVDERGIEIDGYGLRVGPGHRPVEMRRFRDANTRAMVTTGLTYPPPGRGRRESIVRFLRDGVGPATVEAFRHGYEPERTFINLVAGEVTRVRMVLREAPEADWQPRVTWAGREEGSRQR